MFHLLANCSESCVRVGAAGSTAPRIESTVATLAFNRLAQPTNTANRRSFHLWVVCRAMIHIAHLLGPSTGQSGAL